MHRPRGVLACWWVAIFLGFAACYQEPDLVPYVRTAPSLAQLVDALPRAQLVVAIDAAQLRHSPLAMHVWRRMSRLSFALSMFSDNCMDAAASTERLVIATSRDFKHTLVIDQGLSRADVRRCQASPEYQRVLQRLHLETMNLDRYQAIASHQRAQQTYWMGPRLAVMYSCPMPDQIPVEAMWVIGLRATGRRVQGALDDLPIRVRLALLGYDSSAPIRGFGQGPTGVEMVFAIHVDEVAEVHVSLLAPTPAAATTLVEQITRWLAAQREHQMFDVGFARASGSLVEVTVRMSEDEVWDLLAQKLASG